LQWRDGERWGTGALIGPDLFLTAGHCFDGDGKPIPPSEIATLMRVDFRYQIDGASGRTRPALAFPVVELLEHRRGGVHYAIVRLGRDAAGRLPVELSGRALAVAAADLTTPGARLCVIQHPDRREKKLVETGTLLTNDGKRITYAEIDTAGFASGSPVLAESGEIVGVHVFGGCGLRSPAAGFNNGVAIGAIRRVSRLL
jgi:V8-like Glu-specific endopeptidase